MQISELINQACKKVGSSTKLAEVLEVPQPAISMWKNGSRPCPPEDQARIAELAGFDPLAALVGAVLERHAGTAKGEALSRVLGKWAPKQKAPSDGLGADANWRKRRDSNPR
ncbi:YdaS family helix-turn-helix protein [Giesbergeria sp.]|uniref:YdaS family helix-turn-helix protein n=1 Tax=Giesbergeria sp. TaxID=2818473 RepID=UPI003441C357